MLWIYSSKSDNFYHFFFIKGRKKSWVDNDSHSGFDSWRSWWYHSLISPLTLDQWKREEIETGMKGCSITRSWVTTAKVVGSVNSMSSCHTLSVLFTKIANLHSIFFFSKSLKFVIIQLFSKPSDVMCCWFLYLNKLSQLDIVMKNKTTKVKVLIAWSKRL